MQDGKSITTRIAVPLATIRGRPTRERRERSGAPALGYLSHGGEADGEPTKKVDEDHDWAFMEACNGIKDTHPLILFSCDTLSHIFGL